MPFTALPVSLWILLHCQPHHTAYYIANRSSWNQATYRLVFGHWDTVFTGLVPDHLLVAHLPAAIIPVIFNVTSAPTGVEIAQIAIVLFLCRIIVEYGFRRGKDIGTYHTANLYWQSIPFWIEQTRALGVPLGHVLEGYFEEDWKPMKNNLREHFNYHDTERDIMSFRAFQEAHSVAVTQYGPPRRCLRSRH